MAPRDVHSQGHVVVIVSQYDHGRFIVRQSTSTMGYGDSTVTVRSTVLVKPKMAMS